jgi:hypothetical protein
LPGEREALLNRENKGVLGDDIECGWHDSILKSRLRVVELGKRW